MRCESLVGSDRLAVARGHVPPPVAEAARAAVSLERRRMARVVARAAAQAAWPFDASSVEWPWLASRATRRRGGPARDSPLRRRSPATPLPADARQLCARADDALKASRCGGCCRGGRPTAAGEAQPCGPTRQRRRQRLASRALQLLWPAALGLQPRSGPRLAPRPPRRGGGYTEPTTRTDSLMHSSSRLEPDMLASMSMR